MRDSGDVPELELKGSAYLRSEKPVAFRLQLGEFVLCRKSFDAVVLYFELGEHPELEVLAAANLRYGPHDLVSFPNVDATLRTGLLRWSSGRLWYAPAAYPLYCVDLKGSFEDYLGKFSQKSRKNLRRDREKLKRLSGNDEYFREYRLPGEMRHFCSVARSISAKTYQERLLGVGLQDSPEFVEDMIRRAEQDLVRGYILYDKDHPIAFAYCSGRGKQLTYSTIGYDPAYTDHSPGRVLLYCLLDRLFAEQRFELFDFGMGDGFYKSFFSTHSFNCANIFCFRLSAKNLAFVMSHAGLVALSRAVVRLTQALRVKDKIKKWLRANVGRS